MRRSLPDGCVGRGTPGEGSSLWKNHKGMSQLGTLFIVWGAVNSHRAEDRERVGGQCRMKLQGQRVPSRKVLQARLRNVDVFPETDTSQKKMPTDVALTNIH